MKLDPAYALLKKDLKLNRVPILGGAALIFMPYIVGWAAFLTFRPKTPVSMRLHDSFAECPLMSLVLTYAISAVFGAVAFAYERRERWADFLAMMPIKARWSIFSKLFISLAFLVPMWAINNYAAMRLLQPAQFPDTDHLPIFSACTMLMCFGVGWLVSSFQSSSAIAACVSIGAALACGLVFAIIPSYGLLPHRIDEIQFCVFASIGAGGFIAGSLCYLRRIAP